MPAAEATICFNASRRVMFLLIVSGVFFVKVRCRSANIKNDSYLAKQQTNEEQMEQVTVFIPASIANMGCGFDIMGMAVESAGDILSMEMSEGDGIEIINRTDYDIPSTVEDNVMTPSIRAMLNAAGVKKSIKITLMCKIMPGSGIGSSAASAAGAVVALNHLLGNRFSEKEMVEFAMEGEALSSGGAKHADNVAPAILGGIVLICSYHPFEYIRIPFPETFCAAIAHPRITVKTSESRAVLPKDIPLPVVTSRSL